MIIKKFLELPGITIDDAIRLAMEFWTITGKHRTLAGWVERYGVSSNSEANRLLSHISDSVGFYAQEAREVIQVAKLRNKIAHAEAKAVAQVLEQTLIPMFKKQKLSAEVTVGTMDIIANNDELEKVLSELSEKEKLNNVLFPWKGEMLTIKQMIPREDLPEGVKEVLEEYTT